MGGSGSTGSSLLKNIINRHSLVFAGGETFIFAKKLCYTNWKSAKKRLTKRGPRGLRNYGYHLYNGTDALLPEYLWNRTDLESMLRSSTSFAQFADQYFVKAMFLSGASIWLEKSPANSACFQMFLQAFGDGKVVHVARNPYDTIASLMARGFDVYYATGIYLLGTASGLVTRSSDRCHTIKYEDLVDRPVTAVSELCDFLGITYQQGMESSRGEQVPSSQLEGWHYDETEDIGTGSVGRFAKLPEEEQDLIMQAVSSIAVSDRGASYYGLDLRSIEQVCSALGYDYYPLTSRSQRSVLQGMRRIDRLTRIKRGYLTGIHYPLMIR